VGKTFRNYSNDGFKKIKSKPLKTSKNHKNRVPNEYDDNDDDQYSNSHDDKY